MNYQLTRVRKLFLHFSLGIFLLSCSQLPFAREAVYTPIDGPELNRRAADAYQKKNYQKAATLYERAFNHNQDDATLPYNIACCYALLGDEEKAINFIDRAFRNGFRGLDLFLEDPDFDSLRDKAAFQAKVEELRERFKAIGKLDYVSARSFLPYRMRLPKAFNASKPYPLLIGLHGSGGNADGFISLFDKMGQPDIIFVAPEGQYDLILSVGPHRPSRSWDLPDAPKSMLVHVDEMVNEYIQSIIHKVRSEFSISEVYLMGYSQGASHAYTIALMHPETVRGVIGLSGYLMELDDPHSLLKREDIAQAESLRVFMAHGVHDASISVERARELRDLLESQGIDVTYREYEGRHGLNQDVLLEAIQWMSVQ